MTAVDGAVTGSIAGEEARPSQTYKKGRKCCVPGCKTTLSIYNPNDQCGNHEAGTFRTQFRTRGVKYK